MTMTIDDSTIADPPPPPKEPDSPGVVEAKAMVEAEKKVNKLTPGKQQFAKEMAKNGRNAVLACRAMGKDGKSISRAIPHFMNDPEVIDAINDLEKCNFREIDLKAATTPNAILAEFLELKRNPQLTPRERLAVLTSIAKITGVLDGGMSGDSAIPVFVGTMPATDNSAADDPELLAKHGMSAVTIDETNVITSNPAPPVVRPADATTRPDPSGRSAGATEPLSPFRSDGTPNLPHA